MTEITRQIIQHPNAWTTASVGGKQGLYQALSDQHLTAIDAILTQTRDIAPQAVTRLQFDHPALNAFFAQLRAEIVTGRGAVIITGVIPERYTEEQFERIFWGLGLHLGHAVAQSDMGDRIGHVRHEPNQKTVRGYRSLRELKLHTDVNEIVGLMSVQKSETGGYSQLVSSLSLHNKLLAEASQSLEALYRGSVRWIYETRSVTRYAVPLFSHVNGTLSCSYYGVEDAANLGNASLPDELMPALEAFRAAAEHPDICLNFMLEPGEMMLWNNYTLLHARTAFENSPQRQRHLLRLWLDLPDGRQVVRELQMLADEYRKSDWDQPAAAVA